MNITIYSKISESKIVVTKDRSPGNGTLSTRSANRNINKLASLAAA